MISHKHKCIFIHIPKTAGTSITNHYFYAKNLDWRVPNYDVLYGWCPKRNIHLQHATSRQLLELDLITEEIWKSYYKFTFVRNPYDRAYSDYLWMMTDRNVNGSFFEYLNKRGEFESTLKDNSSKYYRGDHLINQTDFFDFSGIMAMDYIARFEKINLAIRKINKRLNLSEPLTKHFQKNTNRSKYYADFYNEESRLWVYNKYKTDLELLKYRFDKKKSFKAKLASLLKH
ncbi:sulfotransferase family 2 domain-containing protein [Aequorivita echinoideorum]|uniref:Sulfotransferase family 2 domain-containing protein n=1 Tax=Aequorivita echinoideorum TaxID=1549647 RepID=A0ABS5S978_9FLAO|nr:sulfotransferase family 2 domain-containing protein [Aequorivita echinoideorum]MBT0608440.1 sulfotransferase family 2 domain-containing protein [Aequorivita echinoideorum]